MNKPDYLEGTTEDVIGWEAYVGHIVKSEKGAVETNTVTPDLLRCNFRKILLAAACVAAAVMLCGGAKKAGAESNFSPEQIAQLDLPEDKAVFSPVSVEKKEKTPEELFRVFLRAPDESEMTLNSINMPFDTQGWFLIAQCDKDVPDNECVGETERGQFQSFEIIEVINPDGTTTIRRLVIFSLDQVKGLKVAFGKEKKVLKVEIPVYSPQPALEPMGPPEEKSLPLPPEKELILEEEVVELQPEHPEHEAGVIEGIIDSKLKDAGHKERFLRVTAGTGLTVSTNDPDKRKGGARVGVDGALLWNTGDLTRVGFEGGLTYMGATQAMGNPEGVRIINGGDVDGHEICASVGSAFEKAWPVSGNWRTGVSAGLDFEGCVRTFGGKENIGVSETDYRQMMNVKGANRFVPGIRVKLAAFLEHTRGFFASLGIPSKFNLGSVQKDASSDSGKDFAASMDVGISAGYQF